MDMQDEIARTAYELYEQNGCVPGRDLENWLQAEKIVLAKYGQKGKKIDMPKVAAVKPVQKKSASRF